MNARPVLSYMFYQNGQGKSGKAVIMEARDGGVVIGEDGKPRCPWGAGPADYTLYHDAEWGVPVHGERDLYERLMLEAFQSGLSWLTILRRRDGMREAFDGFDPDIVARYVESDVARLMQDVRIIRNRRKVDAAITNARAVVALREGEGLSSLIWRHQPEVDPAPVSVADVPASTPESVALAKALKAAGFVFVGPTTAYAMMQAIGMVNDHLAGCHCRNSS